MRDIVLPIRNSHRIGGVRMRVDPVEPENLQQGSLICPQIVIEIDQPGAVANRVGNQRCLRFAQTRAQSVLRNDDARALAQGFRRRPFLGQIQQPIGHPEMRQRQQNRLVHNHPLPVRPAAVDNHQQCPVAGSGTPLPLHPSVACNHCCLHRDVSIIADKVSCFRKDNAHPESGRYRFPFFHPVYILNKIGRDYSRVISPENVWHYNKTRMIDRSRASAYADS